MRRKLLLTLILAHFAAFCHAQSAYEEILADLSRSASNYMAYPGPSQQQLTPPPPGMTPFYLSHYGRHGSRFHSKISIYDAPYLTLVRADSLGKLTALGRDVMHRLDVIRRDADDRWGELTTLGGEQMRQIARRMTKRFPELFTGEARVEALSTTLPRCVLSMQHTLLELQQQNTRLSICFNASHRDMDFLNHQDKELMALKFNKEANAVYLPYLKQHDSCPRLMESLFNDTAYIAHQVDDGQLSMQLILVAAIMQNTELGRTVSLYDLFTPDEVYRLWKTGNLRWYIGWGAAPVNGGIQPYTQCTLLRRLIADADSCISSPQTHVQLRFGHETVVMPLVCLLNIDGYGLTTDDYDHLDSLGWVNYRIFPMAANLQFVFYRRHAYDRDVVFKVLLNENEATLPLPSNIAPYYRWSDFRRYCLELLEKGESALARIHQHSVSP